MKKLSLLLCLCILLTGCVSSLPYEAPTDILGLDLSGAELLSSHDDHGGFHGDGVLTQVYAVPELNPNGFPGWHKLPCSASVSGLLDQVSSLVEVPAVEEGWYFFYDRHPEGSDPYSDQEVLLRGSYNFTLALYDAAEGRLYFVKLDT